jgi:hypothetical protein
MVNLRETGKAIPYVTMGAGVVFNRGDAPSATLVGTYQLGAPGQIVGTDTVNLRYSLSSRTYVGLGGAGLRYFITPTRGIRSPFPLINTGALQFSSTAPLTGVSISATPGAVSAAGTLAPGLTTFAGTGLLAQVGITLGFFLRF